MKLLKSIFAFVAGAIVILTLIVALPASKAMADSVGPNYPAVGTNVTGIGTVAWQNPGNISDQDTITASALLIGRVTSNYLQGSEFGFNVPPEATITGIELTINRAVSDHNAGVYDNVVKLVKNGSIIGENRALTSTIWTTAFTLVTYGGPTDLWGESWLPEDVNNTNFGAVISVSRTNNGNNNRQAEVDNMQITVYYVFTSDMSVSCGDGTPVVTYGDSLTCQVTVTHIGGSVTPDGDINWTSDGSGSFSPNPCNLDGQEGTATCTTTYTPGAVGSEIHKLTASYDGGTYFAPNSAYQNVSVQRRPLAVTADPQTKVYGDQDPEFTYDYTPELVFDDTFTGTLTRDAGEIVGQYAITRGTLAVTADYDLTYTGNFLEITPAEAQCTVTPYDVTFNGEEHTATGSCVGVHDEELAGLDLSGTTHIAAGSYTDAWTFTDTTENYTDQDGTIVNTINKAAAVCEVTAYDVTYDGTAHTATGSCTGVTGEELTGLDLSGTIHTNAGSYDDTWTFTNANYSDQSGPLTNEISKATATCTIEGWTGVYDSEAHGASGECLGVDDKPLAGVDLGDSYTNVPGGTADWTFSDASGNYSDASGSVDIEISKADAVCTVTPYKVAYDGLAHTATGSCLGVEQEQLAGLDLAGTTHTEVGIYTDSWIFTDETGNYNDQGGTVTNEITKQMITIYAPIILRW
ncbi:MAG: hypothetical protein C3F13_13230 [Anaerolineales bacterium]|nr:MAG: hypothetical protein C3F13_13230 [Anaerolineales bacterium]